MTGQPRFCAATNRAAVCVSGSDRLEFLERMLSRRFTDRRPGDAVHALLLDPKGHVLANLAAYVGPADVLCVTDTTAVSGAVAALQRSVLRSDVQIVPYPGEVAAVLDEGSDPDDLNRKFGTKARILVSPQCHGWVEIVGVGDVSSPGQGPGAELGERDGDGFERWRIERGIPRHGHELTGREFPQEARLDRAIDFHKGCYPGQETVARIHYRGHVNRLLVGLRSDAPLRPAQELRAEDKVVGSVTSALDCADGGWIGLGYVARAHAQPGSALTVVSGGLVRAVGLPCGDDAGQHSDR